MSPDLEAGPREIATIDLQGLGDPCATAVSGTTTTNLSTRYTYDAGGALASMIDANGNTTTYGYDAAGRMTSRTDALAGTVTYGYDALGNRTRQTNRVDPPLSDSITWTYDAAGRMTTRTADGVTVTYTYDATGNRLTASDGTLTITTTYDRLGRPLTVDDEDAGTTADTTYSYSLTAPGWTDPTGTYAVTLDRFERPVTLNDPFNSSDFTWTYGPTGAPLTAGLPNGTTTTYTYDAIGRETSRATKAGATNRVTHAATFNRAGFVTSATDRHHGHARHDVYRVKIPGQLRAPIGCNRGPKRSVSKPRAAQARAGPRPLRERLCDSPDMPTNLNTDPRLLERAVEVSGERTKSAVVTRALREFVARHEQRRLVELFGALDWDPASDHKADRSGR